MRFRQLFSSILLLFFSITRMYASPIEDAWKAILDKDLKKARTLLETQLKTDPKNTDANLLLLQLNRMEARKGGTELVRQMLSSLPDQSPYLYALFFEAAVTDGADKLAFKNFELLSELRKSKNLHPSLQRDLTATMGLHHLSAADRKEAKSVWAEMGHIPSWQMTGLFDNSSGSGFDKNYPPIQSPEPNAEFVSKNNARVSWFVPAYRQPNPWLFLGDHMDISEGVAFLQTFVTSASEQNLIIGIGLNGSAKVWVNDQLVIAQKEELHTGTDNLRAPCQLKAGVNRILVQLGFTSGGSPYFMANLSLPNGGTPQGLTYSTEYKPYPKLTGDLTSKQLPHFAATYFKKAIENEPDNLLNYLLLARAYSREKRYTEAVDLLKAAEEISPDNAAIVYDLLQVYNSWGRRTDLLVMLDRLRKLAPDLPLILIYDVNLALDRKDFSTAEKNLERFGTVYGEDSELYREHQIQLLAKKDAIGDLIKVVDLAHNRYPNNELFFKYQYFLYKNNNKFTAITLLESYLRSHENLGLRQLYWGELEELGRTATMLTDMASYEAFYQGEYITSQIKAKYYFDSKNYAKAEKEVLRNISIAPFRSSSWMDLVYISEELQKKEQAREAAGKAVQYNPNNFKARDKLRVLEGKKPLLDLIRVEDAEERIAEALQKPVDSDENYRYLFRENSILVFPEGSFIEYGVLGIQVYNEEGIDYWKESSFGINYSRQNLIVDKAEVVKKDGEKIQAERNGTDLVFPSLQIGDVVFLEYRIENYSTGSLRKEFWYNYTFNGFQPIDVTSFRLILPKGYQFRQAEHNLPGPPLKEMFDDFESYTWEYTNPVQARDEPFMPYLSNVGMHVSVSSVQNWRRISDWYSDLALPNAKTDYHVEDAFRAIFPNGTGALPEEEIARSIYDYICDKIRYSSVSFRQSSHVPQEPGTTLSTQLGDCKDVSTLYHTLAKKAGLKTRLVLVSTRDDGESEMLTPTNEFNHCIIRIDMKHDTLYQELTDSRLPFGVTPNAILQAQALVIPLSPSDPVGNELIRIPGTRRVQSSLRKAYFKVEGSSLKGNTQAFFDGGLASGYRSKFSGQNQTDTRKSVVDYFSGFFDKEITLNSFEFKGLEDRHAGFGLDADLEIKNSVLSIAGMKAIKPEFFELIFNIKSFPDESREFPVEYWVYENTDRYETELVIELQPGQVFQELPKDVLVKNFFIDYALTFERESDQKVIIRRKASILRERIPAEKYPEFRAAILAITQAEDVYLGVK